MGVDAREFPGGLLRLNPAFAYAEPPSSRPLPWAEFLTLAPSSFECFFLSFFFFKFVGCASWDKTGIKLMPSALEVQSLNHWTLREIPLVCSSNLALIHVCSLVPLASRHDPVLQPHVDHSSLDTAHPPVQCSYVSLTLLCSLPLDSLGRVSFSFKAENHGRFPEDSLAIFMGATHFRFLIPAGTFQDSEEILPHPMFKTLLGPQSLSGGLGKLTHSY